MIKFIALLMLAAAVLPLAAAEIGAPAPGLQLAEYVKGKPVDPAALKGKKLLVLHFWGTQCRPCDSALPALNEMIAAYTPRDVEFLAIGSDDAAAMKRYPLLDKMNLPVAVDDMVKTADAYLRPGDRLPTDAIIGKDGVLLWLGPAVQTPAALEEILAGRYDLAAAADFDRFDREMTAVTDRKDFKRANELLEARLKKFPDDVMLITSHCNLLAHQLQSPQQALAELDRAIERLPKEFALYETKLKLLRENKMSAQTTELFGKIAERFADRAMLLVQLSENLMRQPVGSYQLISVYVLARSAYEGSRKAAPGERGRAAAALARAYYYIGRLDLAVELQKEAFRLLRGTQNERRATLDLTFYNNARTAAREIGELEQSKPLVR